MGEKYKIQKSLVVVLVIGVVCVFVVQFFLYYIGCYRLEALASYKLA
ncbi:MAG: hypothetical protein Q4Q06_06400 [Bacteroidota bacterium]|nr:hypothetical protein [Bacteroidota bacterium]